MHCKEKEIIEEYLRGSTYKEIQEKYNINVCTASKILKGKRSVSDARKVSQKRGRRILTEEGRQKLRESGKNNIKRSNKCWTKPEKEFVNIIRENGIKVRFPEFMVEKYNINNDDNPTIFAQYPIQRYVCDFVEPFKKIIFRIQGDFWHSNPILYKDDKLTKIQIHNRKRDILAKDFFIENGWEVIDIWESEIYWNKQVVLKKINRISQPARESALQAEGSPFKSECDYKIEDWSEKLRKLWFKPKKDKKVRIIYEKICECCKKSFTTFLKNKKKCNRRCGTKCPEKEVLEELINNKVPWVVIAKKYNVTDNCIRKWAKKYNIKYKRRRMPKGQCIWNKKQTKELIEQRENIKLN